jgi:hypothetical protein
MRRGPAILGACVLAAFLAPLAPEASAEEAALRRTGQSLGGGTDVRGESGGFEDYLAKKDGEEDSASSFELMRIDEDSRVTLGSEGDEDPSLGLRMGY